MDDALTRPATGTAAIALIALCGLGAIVSGLSTRDHVRFRVSGRADAGACAALVDSGCKAAHASQAAEILGVPISHFGTGFYLAGVGAGVLSLIRRRRGHPARVAPLVSLMGLGAVGYSVYLATLLIRSGEACPFCFVLYGVNAALLVHGLAWWKRGDRQLSLLGVVLAVAVGGASFAGTTPFVLRALAATPTAAAPRPLSLPSRVPSKGDATAADDVIEFSDFECPHCASLHRTVGALFENLGAARLRVRFVNFPLDRACNPHVARSLHPTACVLALGGLCAQEQGRFWPFAEAAFALQSRTRAVLLDTARQVGLDADGFAACLDAKRTAQALAEDIELAHAAGVVATPTVIVNGRAFEGALPRAQLLKILDETAPCTCERHSGDAGTCTPEQDTCTDERTDTP